MFDWKTWHVEHFQRIELALVHALPAKEDGLDKLYPAMAYAVRAGGKRIRPLLVYASWQLGEKLKEEREALSEVDSAAMAIEMMHTYSLVHDDLPSMDNDDLRRGKPTTHKAFSEYIAILAGDALQAESFHILSMMQVPAKKKVEMIRELALSAGQNGMCKGQAIDLAHVGKQLNLESLEKMHLLKTGALLNCAIQMGSILGGLDDQQRRHLKQFAHYLGLGFQVTDDILDATQNSETLGKTAGKDDRSGKPTYVSLMGLDAAQTYSKQLMDKALLSLESWGKEAEPLRAITNWVFIRNS
jgi:farnesyl diphosphate synthase